MDSNNVNLQDALVNLECAKCKEHEAAMEEMGAALLILAFVGPIIGILIGLFAGKKLLNK